jgi:type IV pilus assembly protein PilA
MHTTTTSKVSQLRERLAHRNAERLGEESEEGFTLIELMVVLLILAILLAIAIPTFLGVKGGAQDRASQSNLTNALIVAKTVSANNNGSYPTAITTALNTAEPSLSFVTGTATSSPSNTVSVAVSTDNGTIVMTSLSQSGTCWVAVDDQTATNPPTGLSANMTVAKQGDYYSSYPTSTTVTCGAAALTTGLTFLSSYPT